MAPAHRSNDCRRRWSTEWQKEQAQRRKAHRAHRRYDHVLRACQRGGTHLSRSQASPSLALSRHSPQRAGSRRRLSPGERHPRGAGAAAAIRQWLPLPSPSRPLAQGAAQSATGPDRGRRPVPHRLGGARRATSAGRAGDRLLPLRPAAAGEQSHGRLARHQRGQLRQQAVRPLRPGPGPQPGNGGKADALGRRRRACTTAGRRPGHLPSEQPRSGAAPGTRPGRGNPPAGVRRARFAGKEPAGTARRHPAPRRRLSPVAGGFQHADPGTAQHQRGRPFLRQPRSRPPAGEQPSAWSHSKRWPAVFRWWRCAPGHWRK